MTNSLKRLNIKASAEKDDNHNVNVKNLFLKKLNAQYVIITLSHYWLR